MTRQDRKKSRIQTYVENEAPWHKTLIKKLDISSFPMNPSDGEIENLLQQEKYKQEVAIRHEVKEILKDSSKINDSQDLADIVSKISDSGKNDLAHYISSRKQVLDIFEKSLGTNSEGSYSSENVVHNIIFPTKSDSIRTSFSAHNLWIIDERLNFTNYIASDIPLNGGTSERADLLIYHNQLDHRLAFRGDNESSNPVTIFEFKKPDRDDFANPSSKEDPIAQINRYTLSIKDGKYKTPDGRGINIAENTPFYGYVICTLTPKVKNWLRQEKNFLEMPDGMGWYQWIGNNNLYIEVLSWDKLLKDADMRNKIFFQKLGI